MKVAVVVSTVLTGLFACGCIGERNNTERKHYVICFLASLASMVITSIVYYS